MWNTSAVVCEYELNPSLALNESIVSSTENDLGFYDRGEPVVTLRLADDDGHVQVTHDDGRLRLTYRRAEDAAEPIDESPAAELTAGSLIDQMLAIGVVNGHILMVRAEESDVFYRNQTQLIPDSDGDVPTWRRLVLG